MQTQAAQVINWIAQVSIPLFSGLHADLFDLYNERTSLCLNPFVFRASCRRIGICLAARVQVSQSLCFQGFMQTSARSRTAHGPAGLNPFVFRASCRQVYDFYTQKAFASQSLCFQGFMQTNRKDKDEKSIKSQSLCFQGFMQTLLLGWPVKTCLLVSIPLFSGLHADPFYRRLNDQSNVSIPLFSGLHADQHLRA